MTIEIVYIGEDNWGRKLFRDIKTRLKLCLVDNVLYTVSRGGEPECPLNTDYKVVEKDVD